MMLNLAKAALLITFILANVGSSATLEAIDDCWPVSKADSDADSPGADHSRAFGLHQSEGNHGIFSPSGAAGVSIQPWDKNIIVIRSNGKDVTKMNFFSLGIKGGRPGLWNNTPYYYLKGDGKCLLRNTDYLTVGFGTLYHAKNW